MGTDKLGSYPMVGGDGPASYAQNSSYQKGVADAAKEKITEAIARSLDLKTLELGTSNALKIVDMGCSAGPNTFIAIQNIVNAINQSKNPDSILEFHVFFNDHAGNDFNTLFRTLSPSRKYFMAGVPGSFHSRLFPRSSLHIVHSSCSLHWLSKVPAGIADRESPAWNKDDIYCRGSIKEVADAYSCQCKSDLGSFLGARSEEIVPGGLMIIIMPALPNGVTMHETTAGLSFDFLGSCLVDMANMGILSEEKVNTFNLPLYFPSLKELDEVLQANGCFTVERMDVLENPTYTASSTEHMVRQLRAAFEEVVKEHFGCELVDEIFNFISTKLSEKSIIFQTHKKQNNLYMFILLKRVIG